MVTENGRAVPYDLLIVATGLKLDFAGIEGTDVNLIGQNGLGGGLAGTTIRSCGVLGLLAPGRR